jgi:NAD(P)-dependent dehydrogenase (short-subunit alcohol dehydrogenase family)
MNNPFELAGKNILLVGASSGVGQATASLLCQLKASVVMVDENAEILEGIRSGLDFENLYYVAFPIYQTEYIGDKFKELFKRFGTFHGFVYCAGIGGVRPLSLISPAFNQEMMNANYFTFLEFIRHITKKPHFAQGGSIIAISSVSSIKGLKSKIAYSASKAALDASIRNLAAELSDKKIRVNSIQKGWVSSDMEKDFIKSNMSLSQTDDLKRQLLGVIEPEEVANAIAFLLSDASKSITGISLLLDGGYTL